MYNNKTTNTLKIIVKLCYVGLAVVIIALWLFLKSPMFEIADEYAKHRYAFIPIVLTALMPAGYTALYFIDKLLTNVKNDNVFDKTTIKYLDVVSYSCVVASVIGAISVVVFFIKMGISITTILSLAGLSLGALFMSLILKVIKKVFSKAIELKEENDLTI